MTQIGILGYGEVGKAIHQLYSNKEFSVQIKDLKNTDFKNIEILHVCIPYNNDFLDVVIDEITKSNPLLTIIHTSTLPGTTKRIQDSFTNNYIVHSPVRGDHPRLAESFLSFVKYIGSDTDMGLHLSTEHLNKLNINTKSFQNSFSTELSKLLCSAYYGLCIAWHDVAHNMCKRHSLNFDDVMTCWNTTYNQGYKEMGVTNVQRPVLYPPNKKISGHCVIPNVELLDHLVESSLIQEILKFK